MDDFGSNHNGFKDLYRCEMNENCSLQIDFRMYRPDSIPTIASIWCISSNQRCARHKIIIIYLNHFSNAVARTTNALMWIKWFAFPHLLRLQRWVNNDNFIPWRWVSRSISQASAWFSTFTNWSHVWFVCAAVVVVRLQAQCIKNRLASINLGIFINWISECPNCRFADKYCMKLTRTLREWDEMNIWHLPRTLRLRPQDAWMR